MNDFHNTVIGRKFYEQQMPELIKALNRLADSYTDGGNKALVDDIKMKRALDLLAINGVSKDMCPIVLQNLYYYINGVDVDGILCCEKAEQGYVCSEIYTPQTFLEVLTGNCYIVDGDNDAETIHDILAKEGIENDTTDTLWDYSLDEIQHIVEANVNVVLVEVCRFDINEKLIKEYRWFEIPDTFVEKFKKMENSL